MSGASLSLGQLATLACLVEVSTPKPGNVHRGADFDDATFYDFVASAVAIAPAVELAARTGRVGEAVLAGVQATRRVTATNTNLGTLLLIAPLACVPREKALAEGIADVLRELTADDARLVYEAIRVAQPGGLGKVNEMDVAAAPPADLLAAMRAAAERDFVARQYTNDFQQVLSFVAPALAAGVGRGWGLAETVIHTHVRLLSEYPDSLIARKCGIDVAREAAGYAGQVLATGEPGDGEYHAALADLDFWLRSDGHRRNPGTSADLIAAGLFAAFREGALELPARW